jgi:hypothetical protein
MEKTGLAVSRSFGTCGRRARRIAVRKEEEPIYYTARHLLQALNSLEEGLLDLPLMLIHGKDLTKPNLVSGILPTPILVDRDVVEAKKPSLLALAALK